MAKTARKLTSRQRLRAEAANRLQKRKIETARDRSRLIDHFKRLYTIIAGLAITEACRKLMPLDPATFSAASFWMFVAFLITIVPIFQGGDRSLDLKYLDEREDGLRHNRLAFIWDVFMLILTALVFVAVAESIPSVSTPRQPPRSIMFFFAMSGLFFFDVIVLIADFVKSHVQAKLANYMPWVLMNSLLGAICLVVGMSYYEHPDYDLAPLALTIALCAAGRTYFDYRLSGRFMFP